jgi:type I restriction enzyme M protein
MSQSRTSSTGSLGPGPHLDFNRFIEVVEADTDEHGLKLTSKRRKMIQTSLAERDPSAQEVIARAHKPGKIEPSRLRGCVEVALDGKRVVVEYEPDGDLRDTEQVPLLEPGGIETFLQGEVLPHAPDAWYDPDSVRTGYEVSFTRYFYSPAPLRSLEEIRADILALEKETEGLLSEILGSSPAGPVKATV